MFLCRQTRKINPAKLTAFTVVNRHEFGPLSLNFVSTNASLQHKCTICLSFIFPFVFISLIPEFSMSCSKSSIIHLILLSYCRRGSAPLLNLPKKVCRKSFHTASHDHPQALKTVSVVMVTICPCRNDPTHINGVRPGLTQLSFHTEVATPFRGF